LFSQTRRYVVTGEQWFLQANVASAKSAGFYKSKMMP